MELNMTIGSPFRLIVKFMIPIILGNLFYQLYSVMDTIIVGQCLGVQALAAVGATGTISFFIFGFMRGLTTGFAIPIAQYFGQGDLHMVKKSMGSGVLLGTVISVVMTGLSVVGMDSLLQVMNTPEDIYALSKEYILVICMGMVFSILSGLLSSILRAMGNSKAPLMFMIVAAIVNVVLDYVFIWFMKMGVAGAALATVLAECVSGILCFLYIWKKVLSIHMKKEHWKMDFSLVKKQFFIGIPMALQFSITAVGTMIVQSALNLFGSTIVAAYIVASKVEGLLTQFFDALGMTMATFGAQNRGKNDWKRIHQGAKIAMGFAILYSVVAFLIMIPTLPFAIRMFITENVEIVLPYARTYITIGTGFFIPLGMILVYRNILQGCGYAMVPMIGGLIEMGSRIEVAILAVRYDSFIGVCFTNASAWITAGVYLFVAYCFIYRKNKPNSKG